MLLFPLGQDRMFADGFTSLIHLPFPSLSSSERRSIIFFAAHLLRIFLLSLPTHQFASNRLVLASVQMDRPRRRYDQ